MTPVLVCKAAKLVSYYHRVLCFPALYSLKGKICLFSTLPLQHRHMMQNTSPDSCAQKQGEDMQQLQPFFHTISRTRIRQAIFVCFYSLNDTRGCSEDVRVCWLKFSYLFFDGLAFWCIVAHQ